MFYVRVLAWGVIATVCRNWTVTVGSEQVSFECASIPVKLRKWVLEWKFCATNAEWFGHRSLYQRKRTETGGNMCAASAQQLLWSDSISLNKN